MNLPDLPLWSWVIVVIFSLVAIILPLWMFLRIPYMRRIRQKAGRSWETRLGFWALLLISYAVLIWLILLGYGANKMF
jgi:hypothetical protein